MQMAAASEHHHHLTKANVSRHHSDFRGAYNLVNGPINVSVTPGALLHDTDFPGDLTHHGLATKTRR